MTTHANVNVLIVDDNDKARAKLIDQLRYPDITIVGESSFGNAAVSWASRLDVDVVIVAVEEPVVRGLRTIDLLTSGETTWPIVAVSSHNDRESMRKAMLAGARDYLVLPASEADVRKSVMLVYQREQERRGNSDSNGSSNVYGTVIAIFGVKGGIGKTVAAVNIAAGIAQGTQNRVALVDADTQFGDCAVMLDLVPERTIVDAAGEVDPATPNLIEPYLTDHPSHLSLLAAPSSPGDANLVTPELVGSALKSLAATHDFVVIDTSPQIDALTALIIDLSSIVLVVVTPEVPCVRRTRAALDLLEAAGYSRDKIKLILNRSTRKAEVPTPDLEEALGYPIYAEIPDDRAVVRAVTRGVPVVMSDAKSEAGRAFIGLGRKLAGVTGAQRAGTGRGWWRKRRHDAGVGTVPEAPHPVAAGALLAAWSPAIGRSGSSVGAASGDAPEPDSLEREIKSSWDGIAGPDSLDRDVAAFFVSTGTAGDAVEDAALVAPGAGIHHDG
jgi:pilus assembly protein CpaE